MIALLWLLAWPHDLLRAIRLLKVNVELEMSEESNILNLLHSCFLQPMEF